MDLQSKHRHLKRAATRIGKRPDHSHLDDATYFRTRAKMFHVCTIGVGLALAALTLWPASASAQLFGGGAGTVYNINWDNYSSAIDRCVGYFTNSCKPQPAKPITQVRKSRARVR